MTGAVRIGSLQHAVRRSEGTDPSEYSGPVEWSDTPLNSAPVDRQGVER
jgi:hypothetical protein